jgi:hypothetical protein
MEALLSASKSHKLSNDDQNWTDELLTPSRTFHQTPYGLAREITMWVQWELGNSSILIQRLENNTDFHLQEFTLKWKIDTVLQTFHGTLGEQAKQQNWTQATQEIEADQRPNLIVEPRSEPKPAWAQPVSADKENCKTWAEKRMKQWWAQSQNRAGDFTRETEGKIEQDVTGRWIVAGHKGAVHRGQNLRLKRKKSWPKNQARDWEETKEVCSWRWKFWPEKLNGKKFNQGQKPALEMRTGHELLLLNQKSQ